MIFIVYNSGLKSDPMKGRLKDLNQRKDQLKAGLVATNKRQSNIKNVDRVNTMRKIADKLKLLQTESTDKISISLAQAGYRNKDALVIYQFSRLITPALGGLLAIFLIYGAGIMADVTYYSFAAGGFYLTDDRLPVFELPIYLKYCVTCTLNSFTGRKANNRPMAFSKTRNPVGRRLAVDRIEQIRRQLDLSGSVTVQELASDMGVSQETIRRDLKRLEKEGDVAVVHGGATRRRNREPALNQRSDEHAEAKRAIARTAVDKFGTPELKELLVSHGVGNHPEMIRFMVKVGKLTGEDVPGGVTVPSNPAADRVSILYPTDKST